MIGGILSGILSGVITSATNLAIELTKGGVKVGSKVVKKGIEVGKKTGEIGKLQLKIIDIENTIKEYKYCIGKVIYDNRIEFENNNINREIERIDRYNAEIEDLKNEYGIAGGNVEELKNEIIKSNEQYATMTKERDTVIDFVEKVKNDVAININDRHKGTEEYIRQVVSETKEMDDDINTEELLSKLDEI